MDIVNSAGIRLFLAAGDEPNLALSPASIGLAFGMLHAGATGGVRAAIERLWPFPPDAPAALGALARAVSRDPADPDDATVTIANAAFLDEEFTALPQYTETLREHFAAVVESLPMHTDPAGSRAAIDAWISENTRGLIERIVPEQLPTADTRLILVNTVYFKASWLLQFGAVDTHAQPFHLADGGDATVQLMSRGGGLDHAISEHWEAVRLPYRGGLDMTVVIPTPGRFGEIQSQLGSGLIARVDAALAPGFIRVALPRFTAEAKIELEDVIAGGLGITDLFGVEGLDGIGPRLGVDAAVHATKVIVDEEGTEAAAATVIAIRAMSMPIYEAEIVADRPFLYVIRDSATGTILFLGRYTAPEE